MTDYTYLFKIVITGDVCCGKTKIIRRFLYNEYVDQSIATIGVEFIPTTVTLQDGTRVRLQLWDTAGCEKYRSITIGHYRNALGAILVYDITNGESFNSLQYWLDELRENTDPSSLILLMPNKVDIMFEHPEEREVILEQGRMFARENRLIFIDECSALADINIKAPIMSFVEAINKVQESLVRSGQKTQKQLKLKDEDTSPHYEGRCCY